MLETLLVVAVLEGTGPADAVFAEVDGTPLHVDATFGDQTPGSRAYVPETACRIVTARIRETLVRRVLARTKRLPSEEDIAQALERHLPSTEAVRQKLAITHKTTTILRDALRRSRSDPTHDHDIWRANVAPYMTYEQWVTYRNDMKGREPDIPPVPDTLSREELLKAAAGLRPLVLEEIFQEWLVTEWAPHAQIASGAAHTRPSPTSTTITDLQRAFWRDELQRTKIVIARPWRCRDIEPTDLVAPRVTWPAMPSTGATP